MFTPENAGWPESISYTIAPSANTSVRSSTSVCWPVACSGAMYCGVPSSVLSCVLTVCEPRIFEMPKSRTFAISSIRPSTSLGTRKMLCGFRSRWTMPSRFAAATAEPTWRMMDSV